MARTDEIVLDSSCPVELFDGVRDGAGRRVWSPYRSKLAAYVARTGDKSALPVSGSVLYLGAGDGYTVSFISDLVDGDIYAVEFSKTAARTLLELARARKNIHPILEDARHPSRYMPQLPPPSWMLQDVSQPEQVRIFLDHLPFLRPGATAMLSLKLESERSGGDPVGDAQRRISRMARIVSVTDLAPYEKRHVMIHARSGP